jgi:hypothetical protein
MYSTKHLIIVFSLSLIRTTNCKHCDICNLQHKKIESAFTFGNTAYLICGNTVWKYYYEREVLDPEFTHFKDLFIGECHPFHYPKGKIILFSLK